MMKYRCTDCGYLVSANTKEFPCMRCGGRKYENTGLYDQSCESNPHILSLRAELAAIRAKYDIWHPASERPKRFDKHGICCIFVYHQEDIKRMFIYSDYFYPMIHGKWAYTDDFAATLPEEGA